MTADGSTSYFAAVCSAGHRPFLTQLVGSRGEPLNPRCPACGTVARLIRGLRYASSEHARFQRIVDLALAHRVPPQEARSVIVFLGSLVPGSEDELRAGLLTVLPPPSSIAPLVSASREELLEIVNLLSELLSAPSEPT